MADTKTGFPILVMNAGSSSQKSCLYFFPDAQHPAWEGLVDWSAQVGSAVVSIKTQAGFSAQQVVSHPSREQILTDFLSTLWQGESAVLSHPDQIRAVGHRVVHGGSIYQQPTLINGAVKAEIQTMAKFAPVHNPANLEGILLTEKVLGESIPQVAVFDTAFHARLPVFAALYPIPYAYYEQGIHRYGFHGISHQYVSQRAAAILHQELSALKIISCHLGNGCSLAAVSAGESVDTTMGFTPLSGLMMGTRSGDIDPGVLVYLLRQGMDADSLDQLLNKQSGLLGVSGISGDLRSVLSARDAGDERAKLAYEVFVHRLRSEIGAMAASMGGVDVLVFTAGMGENSDQLRRDTCRSLGFLGIELDEVKNQQRPVDLDIATPQAQVRVLVIHTQEDWAIAHGCYDLVRSLTVA